MQSKLLSRIKNVNPALKASIAYTICSILQKALSLITMPLFTRILTVEQYGQFSVYTSWSAILSIIITLNLSYGSFGKAMLKFEDDRRGYIASIQSLVIIFAVACLAVYLPFASFFNELLSLSTSVVVLMIGEVFFQFSILCWYGLKRYEFKYIGVIIITLLTTVISPALSLILIKFTDEKGYARIAGYALVNIGFGLALFITNYVKGKRFFKKEYWKYALKFNLPLIAYYLSQVVFNASDKIMIEKLLGMEESGLYSVAYSLSLMLTFVLNAINNSYVPWLYEKIKSGQQRDNIKLSILITIIMCVLVGGVIWLGPELVYVMAGEQYASAVWVIPPVSVSLVLLLYSQFFINVQFYYESRIKLVLASIGAALINIGLNYWLIPIYGFVAAGYTTLICYVLFVFCNYLCVCRVISKKGELAGIYNLPILLILFVAFVGLSYVGVLLYSYMWVRLGIIIAVLLVLIIFHKKIIKLAKSLIGKKIAKAAETADADADNGEIMADASEPDGTHEGVFEAQGESEETAPCEAEVVTAENAEDVADGKGGTPEEGSFAGGV